MSIAIDHLAEAGRASESASLTQELPVAEVLGQVAGLVRERKYDEVQALIQCAMSSHPTNGNLVNARGYVLSAMGRQREALTCYRDALELDRSAAGIWNNLGTAFKQRKYFNMAIACHKRAIALSGEEAFIHHNLGLCYADSGQHGEAIMAFNRAIELQPDFHIARWDRARSFLYLGNYRQGWADYEVRLVTGQLPARAVPGHKWTGSAYPGRRLILLAEQGFGDTLWVLRYLARVKGQGGELFVECQPALCSLVEAQGVADRVIPYGERLPDADYHAHLCSLPSLFTSDLSCLSPQPYLRAPQEREATFHRYFSEAPRSLKVGIVWSGSVTFGRNADRALPLERLLPAIDLPGVQLYSLQKGPPEGELRDLPQQRPIIDLAPDLNDFADTAAAVSKLDLIIMTDSAVAHLAGGLGIPVWILLGHSAHWLWLLDRTDSPWYTSARLFRPRVEGDWDYVLDNVAAELLKWVGL